MSKSIYDEAIETLLGVGSTFIAVPCNPIGEENSDMIHLRNSTVDYENEMSKVVKALKQAQKQEKLLELYKEALETNFEGITLIKLVNKTLRTQIKELENE